jgi:uncharacterized protein (UPF0276 family)
MKLAVNYSVEAQRLLDRGEIDFDLYKCPDWPAVIAEARGQRPCYVHWGLRAGTRALGEVDWAKVDDLLASTDTPAVNVHLSPRVANFPGMSIDTTDPRDRVPVVEAMVADVERLVQRFGVGRVIVENAPWDPTPPWHIPRPALLPDVICEVVARTGCGFLLDLAHAAIAALHLGVDPKAYIRELPLDRIQEMHITGLAPHWKGWTDHHPMREEDWTLLGWALDRIRLGDWPEPRVVTFEYGGVGPAYEQRSEERVLAEQVPRLLECVRAAAAN